MADGPAPSPVPSDPDAGTGEFLRRTATYARQGQGVMRISVINWWTRDDDIERSLDAIRRALAASRAAG